MKTNKIIRNRRYNDKSSVYRKSSSKFLQPGLKSQPLKLSVSNYPLCDESVTKCMEKW